MQIQRQKDVELQTRTRLTELLDSLRSCHPNWRDTCYCTIINQVTLKSCISFQRDTEIFSQKYRISWASKQPWRSGGTPATTITIPFHDEGSWGHGRVEGPRQPRLPTPSPVGPSRGGALAPICSPCAPPAWRDAHSGHRDQMPLVRKSSRVSSLNSETA